MAQQKQQRIIKSKPDVLVATPGRLWELICDNSVKFNKCQNELLMKLYFFKSVIILLGIFQKFNF